MNGSVTTEHGHTIIGSSFGDNNHFEYYNVQTSSSQTKDSVKYLFYGVPAKNQAFVDRPEILASMEVALSSPSNECRILALKGLGGMGKTQLMLQYCYLHRTAYEYVFWLEVDSWSAAIESFRGLAINLGLDEENAKGKDSGTRLIDWVCSWLQKKTKWLLLLNNADDIMSIDIFKLLPRIGGDIILTTREPISSRMAIVILVNKMKLEEALFLLFGISSVDLIEQNSQKLHYAREIVTELDFLPLAIDLARAYINNTLISFQQYLSMFKDSKRCTSLFRYNDEDSSNLYKHNIETVWQLSFKKIRVLNPAAVQILEACAFLQPEAIPACLFRRQYSVLELISPSSVGPASENYEQPWEFIGNAVAVLIKFSFVTRTYLEAEGGVENPANDLLTIHRLVQKVIYETMNDDQKLRWAYNISKAFNKDTHYVYSAVFAPSTRIIIDPYLSHIRHFVTILDNHNQKPFISKDLTQLLNRVIWYLLEHRRYSGIEELVQFSRLVSEVTYGEEDKRIVRPLINHAEFHRRLGKFDEAEPLYQRALAIQEKMLGPEHQDTATSLHSLAEIYQSQGRYDEAEPLYKRDLAITEKMLEPEHPNAATSLHSLAELYRFQGKYDEAEPLYQRVLAIYEKKLGLEHHFTAISLHSLARLYNSQGKYDEAELLYKRDLAISEKISGPEHPYTAISLHSLAGLYVCQGLYDEAEPLYKRDLAIIEKVFGSEHLDIAISLRSLAGLYVRQGKYDKAEPLYQRALAIQEKMLRPEHPEIATTLHSRALLYQSQGKYDKAESLYKQALVIREKTLGLQHPDTATTLDDLAKLYVRQGKYDEAEPLNKRALAIHEKVLGPKHPATAMSIGTLAELLVYQRNYDDAEPLFNQALTVLIPMHPDTASLVNNFGNLYKSQGKFDDAEVLFQRSLNIHEKVLGHMHPATASSVNSLGDLYILQGKYDDAEPLCKLALKIREKVLGPVHPDTATSLNNMGNLYMGQGKYVDAEPFIQQALEIRQQMLGPNHPDTATSAKSLADLREMQGQHNNV